MATRDYACRILRRSNSEINGWTGEPKAVVPVTVSRPPPVAVRRAHVPRFVVPRTAAQDKKVLVDSQVK
jgi:hypothetical protein